MINQFVNKIISVKINRRLLSCFAFVAILIVAFVGYREYSILHDEAYMALSCENYENAPLAMMTFFVGHWWMDVFGGSFLSLRILTRICILIAIGIGLIYLWRQTHNLLLTSITGLISSISSNLGDISFYNWDTGAYPIVALGTFLLLYFIDNPSLKNLILLGIIGGCMTAFRIPLIGFSVIIVVAIIGSNSNRNIIQATLIAALTFIFGWIGCAFLMTGSLYAYINSFSSDNIITGHSLNSIQSYVDNILMLVPRFVFFLLPVTIGCLLGVLLGHKGRLSLLTFIVGEFILLLIIFAICMSYVSNIASYINEVALPLFLLASFWIYFAKAIGYQNSWLVNDRQNLKLGILILIMILLGFGSDMWFNKWSVIFLLPMSMAIIWPGLNRRSKQVFKLIYLFITPILLLLVPLKEKLINSDLIELNGFSKMESIKMSGYKYSTIESIRTYIDKHNIKSDSIAFIGSPLRYIYAYEFGESRRAIKTLHFYHWEDHHYNKINKIIPNESRLFVIGKYPKHVKSLIDNHGYAIEEANAEFTVLKLIKSQSSDKIR